MLGEGIWEARLGSNMFWESLRLGRIMIGYLQSTKSMGGWVDIAHIKDSPF